MTIPFWSDPDFLPVLRLELDKRGLQFLELLSGEGSTAIVYKAHDPFKEEDKVIKIFFRTGDDIKGNYQATRNKMRHIDHPNVVKLESGGHFSFKDQEIYYFIEEFFNGINLTHIDPAIIEDQDLIRRVILAESLANAIEAIHKVYESHNDLHEGNVLLSDTPPFLKIIDPGSSLHNPVQGSPDYEDFFRIIRFFFRNEENLRFGLVPDKTRTYADFRELKGVLHGFLENQAPSSQNEEFPPLKEIPKPSNPELFQKLMEQWQDVLSSAPLNKDALILTLNRIQIYYYNHAFEYSDNTERNIQTTITNVSILPPQVADICYMALGTIFHYLTNGAESSPFLRSKLDVIQLFVKNSIQRYCSLSEKELQARLSTLNFFFRVLENHSWQVGDTDFLGILIDILSKLNQDNNGSIKTICNNYASKFPLEFEAFLKTIYLRVSDQVRRFILSLGYR